MAETRQYMINVVSQDQVGIIAAVSEALYALEGNLETISQTVVWNWFTMIICATFPEEISEEDVQRAVESAGPFRATVLPHQSAPPTAPTASEPYVITVRGSDKPGIVRGITHRLANLGINIADVWFEVCAGQFIVIFHIAVPAGMNMVDVRVALENEAQALGVSLVLRHQDIFVATNSLSVSSRAY